MNYVKQIPCTVYAEDRW